MAWCPLDTKRNQTFSGILMDAKLERSVVIQGFMIASSEIEKSGNGFGKAYWGNKWRFKIFDGFYTHPKGQLREIHLPSLGNTKLTLICCNRSSDRTAGRCWTSLQASDSASRRCCCWQRPLAQ